MSSNVVSPSGCSRSLSSSSKTNIKSPSGSNSWYMFLIGSTEGETLAGVGTEEFGDLERLNCSGIVARERTHRVGDQDVKMTVTSIDATWILDDSWRPNIE